jgi:thymidylate synthase ThyX
MSVKLISYSQPSDEILKDGISNIQDLVGYCARVSNPSNQTNTETSEKLINYLIRNKHWSPLEMVSICLEINTTRDIARQILRHRSFSFQEFCVSKGTNIKCFSRNQNIDIDIPIELLFGKFVMNDINKYYIYIYDENSKSLKYTQIKEVFNTGEKECIEVKIQVENSNIIKKIVCTPQHKLFTLYQKYKEVGLLQIGDKVYTLVNNEFKLGYIIEKTNVGIHQTYDIEVDNTSHNYIANGVLSHNSQRYSEILSFATPREARLQDLKNRQNSIETDDEELQKEWDIYQQKVIDISKKAYEWALNKGIAKEQARSVLPEGLTMSRMYVNGNVRSWFHFAELRAGNGTQKEHSQIAKECVKVIRTIYPSFCLEINVDE